MSNNQVIKAYVKRDSNSDDRKYRWHPLNTTSVSIRHTYERSLIKLIYECGIELPGSKILDVGCGSGQNLEFCYNLSEGDVSLYGVELVEGRHDSAVKRLAGKGDIILGSADDLPYENGEFDIVFINTVLSSVLDKNIQEGICSEVDRVLSRSGIVIVYDMFPWATRHLSYLSGVGCKELKSLFPKFKVNKSTKLNSIFVNKLSKYNLIVAMLESLPFTLKTNHITILSRYS